MTSLKRAIKVGLMKNNKRNGEWVQYDFKGIPLRKSFYEMGRMIDDELIVVNGSDNPMEELKNYTKKRRKSENSSKAKKSKSILKQPEKKARRRTNQGIR